MKKMYSVFLVVLLSLSMVTPVFAVATPSDASLEDYLANYEKIPLPADNPGLGVVVEEWEGDDGNLVASDSDWSFEAPSLNRPLYVPPALLSSGEDIVNTVSFSDSFFQMFYYNTDGIYKQYLKKIDSNGDFIVPKPDDFESIHYIGFVLDKKSLPPSGKYEMSFHFGSHTGGFTYSKCELYSDKGISNAELVNNRIPVSNFSQVSGSFDGTIKLEIGTPSSLHILLTPNGLIPPYGGTLSVRFRQLSSSATVSGSTAGGGTTEQDMQQNIAQNTASMNDTLQEIVETISKQLEALWNQMYNYIHLEDMANADKNADKIVAGANQNTQEIIDNADENTDEVTGAIEEHGNFIIDGLKGLFIPDDAFFKAYFDDLHGWFSDRFGFLSFPLDLLVKLVELFTQSEDVDCILTLPSFSIMDEQLWEEQSFNLTEFLETHFMFLLTAVRMVTSIYLIMSFVHLCEDKWNEVMMN